MNTRLPLNAILAVSALSATMPASNASAATPVVLENGSLRAEIVPAWAGRLMFFGRKGGENVLWTNPGAENATVDQNGKPAWKNVGGEKTWVGSQGAGWRLFLGIESGPAWPPPAWFDSTPMRVVKADPTNLVLRTAAHAGGDWVVALEREFDLRADCLVMRQRLLPSQVGALGAEPIPDDIRRLWSVAQIPRPEFVEMRLLGGGRHEKTAEIPEPVPGSEPDWVRIDIAKMVGNGKICADGDALRVPAVGGGWFTVEQTAPRKFLDAIEKPGRAMVYASAVDFDPSAYVELEFAAYGPDAEQTLVMRVGD